MLGDWGAYALQSALGDFDEGWGDGESGNVEAHGGGDDGTALLTMMTKCDEDSWCATWEKYNATMTRETFFGFFEGNQGETLSHPWGTAAIPATGARVRAHLAGPRDRTTGAFLYNP